MAPVAYGFMSMLGTAVLIAILVGGIGGAINGRLKADLFLGALSVVGTYLLASAVLDLWLVASAGMLPLILTFLLGSSIARYLETRVGLRPAFAVLCALGSALVAGFLYVMLFRFGFWTLAVALSGPISVWIALGIILYLIILSIQKRMRATK